MVVEGLNLVAIAVAAAAAFVFGGVWYGVLSKQWLAAAQLPESAPRSQGVPLVVSFLAELGIALFMALLIGQSGPYTSVSGGALLGAAVWLGAVLPTLVVNHQFQSAKPQLTLIDGAHWLGVFIIIGAVLAWFGPKV